MVTRPTGQVIFRSVHVLIFTAAYIRFTGFLQIFAGHVKTFAGHVHFQVHVPDGHVNQMFNVKPCFCLFWNLFLSHYNIVSFLCDTPNYHPAADPCGSLLSQLYCMQFQVISDYIRKRLDYRQVSNIRRTLVGNKIVDHSDVVGASPVGAAPTTSSFSTEHNQGNAIVFLQEGN